jgi:hypothetical protein
MPDDLAHPMEDGCALFCAASYARAPEINEPGNTTHFFSSASQQS